MECNYCKQNCQKAGKQKNGQLRYYCKACKKHQQEHYQYAACKVAVNKLLPLLICESVGIRGMARILKVATSTVIRKIKELSDKTLKPVIPMNRKCFELDELCTYVGNKENRYWVAYALCNETKQVIDFTIEKRTKDVLATLTQPLLHSKVGVIKTDRLNIYRSLIPIADISATLTISIISKETI